MNDYEVNLRIKDVDKWDYLLGLTRIDPEIMKELNLKNGNALEIFYPASSKRVGAILSQAKSEDQGSRIIRLAPTLRRILRASIDDVVKIKKIEVPFAEKLVFAGFKEREFLRNSQNLTLSLENYVIFRGNVFGFHTYGRRIDLVVVDYIPNSETVRIHRDTKIVLSDKSCKELHELGQTEVDYEDIRVFEDDIQKVEWDSNMKKMDFYSILYEIFSDLHALGPHKDLVEAISNIPKIREILDKFYIDETKKGFSFTKWCKAISENLEESELADLIKKIKSQEKEFNLDIFI